MPSSSPTLEGFRTIIRRPSFGFAEISWRWSFGAAAVLLIAFSFFEYLATLPVSRLDLLLLKSRNPTLVGQAFAHIFHGSGFRLLQTLIVLVLGLVVIWIAIGAFGRAATVKALSAYFREDSNSDREARGWRLRSLFGLNFFRVATTLAATVGFASALMLGGAAGRGDKPAPGITFLVFLAVLLVVWLAWSAVNWFLSLASIFAVIADEDTFGSIAAAIRLCRDRAGSVFAAGTWFGLAHLVAFVIATSAVAFPLGFARVLPPAVVMGGVLLVTLLYFATADFLYMGRLAAYVSIIEFPPVLVLPQISQPPLPSSADARGSLRADVDQDELILSDIPLQD